VDFGWVGAASQQPAACCSCPDPQLTRLAPGL